MSEPRHRRKAPPTGKQRVLLDDEKVGLRSRELLLEREVLRTKRRRIGWSLLAAVVLMGSAVGVSLLTNRNAPSASSTIPPPAGAGASAVLAVESESGVVSVAIAIAHPDLADQLVLFPPGLITPIPSFGDRELAATVAFGGPELLGLTITNTLGIRVDAVAVIEPNELAGLLPESMEIDLPVPLMIEQGGVTAVAEPAGRHLLGPDRVARLLYEQGIDDQLAWLQRQGAVWKALLAWIGEDEARVAKVARDDGDGVALTAALGSVSRDAELVITGLEVARIVTAGDTDFYQLSSRVAERYLADDVPYLQLRPKRPRIEILNGRGPVVGVTQPVAAQLVRMGFRVVRTDNAASVAPETRVIAQGFDNQEVAKEIQQFLGRGAVILEARQPSTVVDITVILGQDFAN